MNPQKRRLLVTGTSWCDSISTRMSFDKNDIANNCFHFSEKDGTAIVRWNFRKELSPELLDRWSGPFIYSIIAPDLTLGLNRLKSFTEKETEDQIGELKSEHNH